MLRTYQKLRLSNVHVNVKNSHAHTAAIWPIVTRFSHANCMTLATWPTIARLTCRSLTHSTAVQSAGDISMPTSPTWQTPVATIPAELSTWQCGWLLKTGCRIGRHHGIYGETIGFLFLGLRFKTGSRRREKKAEQRTPAEYLDGALADFSGYIAADELYDGPFCVLSIVDNHNSRRLIYEVHSCPRHPMLWSEATVAIERCKRAYIECERKNILASVLLSICNEKNRLKAVCIQYKYFIM